MEDNVPGLDSFAFGQQQARVEELRRIEEEDERLRREQAIRAAQMEEEERQAQAQQEQQRQANFNEDGTPKSSREAKDPKDFSPANNLQEAGAAVAGGISDIADSAVSSVTRLADPDYWKPSAEPYRPDWLPSDIWGKPLTKTVWGNIIRKGVEMGGLMALVRRSGSGIAKAAGKPGAAQVILKGPTKVKGQTLRNIGKDIAHGGAVGAVADAMALDSTGGTITDEIVKIAPQWENALTRPFMTDGTMSPATRNIYNIFEGFGVGSLIDVALGGVGAAAGKAAARGAAKRAKQAAKGAVEAADEPVEEFIRRLRIPVDAENARRVETGAKVAQERAFTSDPINKKEWSKLTPIEQYTAKRRYAKSKKIAWDDSESLKYVEQTAMKDAGDKWAKMTPEQREAAYRKAAKKIGADFESEIEKILKRETNQRNNEAGAGIARITMDPEGRAFDPTTNVGGEVTQGRSFSTDTPRKTFEDVIRIENDPSQRQGSPSNFVPEQEYYRQSSVADDVPAFKEEVAETLRGQGVPDVDARWIADYMPEADAEFKAAVAGRSIMDMSDDEYYNFLSINRPDRTVGSDTNLSEGVEYINNKDYARAVTMSKATAAEIRDLARAGKSVIGSENVAAPGGIIDRMLDRYVWGIKAIKQSNYMRHRGLGDLRDPKKFASISDAMQDIAADANARKAGLKEVLERDPTDESLKLLLDAMSLDASIKNMADLDKYFQKKIGAFGPGSVLDKELGIMAIHNAISAVKTPIRAIAGTGTVAILRPLQTALGAMLTNNKREMAAAWHTLSNMGDSIADGAKLAKKQWFANMENAFGTGNKLPTFDSISTMYTKDYFDPEWEAMREWVSLRGSDAQNAAFTIADKMRWLNHNPIFTWSSRTMNATDLGFRTMMAKNEAKMRAFRKAWDEVSDTSGIMDNAQLQQLTKQYETDFMLEMYNPDGTIADEYLEYAAKEATMTKQMPEWMNNLQKVMDSNPLTRPFLLFARTGTNALELTAKHTPFLNMALKEQRDILSLQAGDPDLLKYGIRTQDELMSARALLYGRQATGWATIMAGANLAMSGRLTGNGPADATKRRAWQQAGWVPRSILLGDKWVSYESLEPFNNVLSAIADVAEMQNEMGEKAATDHLARLWTLVSYNATNKSFLYGLIEFNEMISNPDEFMRGLGSVAGVYVPWASMSNAIGKAVNPGMRELDNGFRDSFWNRNVWAVDNEDLPYKYDILNGSIVQMWDWPTRAWNAVMPFTLNTNTTMERKLLWRSQYDVALSVNTLPGVPGEIPTKLKSKFAKLIGEQNVEAQLGELFRDPKIIDSIVRMEADRDAGMRHNEPSSYPHYVAIDRIFQRARKKAAAQLRQDPVALELIRQNQTRSTAENYRKDGRFDEAQEIQDLIKTPNK